jgi:hypothetical protein
MLKICIMVPRYKNLVLLIRFSNYQKKLKKDIQKVLPNDNKKNAIVLTNDNKKKAIMLYINQ